jgi:hypothetical protein
MGATYLDWTVVAQELEVGAAGMEFAEFVDEMHGVVP